MFRSFLSEWYKIRRRSVLFAGVIMTIFTVVGVYFTVQRATSPDSFMRGGDAAGLLKVAFLQSTQGLGALIARGSQISVVIALILVAASFAAEYSQGTLRNLLVCEPRRIRLLIGKFVAMLLYVVVAETVALGFGICAAFIAAHVHNLNTTLWISSASVNYLLTSYGNFLLGTVAWTLFGVFCAILIRSSAGAIGASLAYLLVVENLLVAIWSDGHQWLFGQLVTSLLRGGDVNNSYGHALLWTGIYTVVFAFASLALFLYSDVTA